MGRAMRRRFSTVVWVLLLSAAPACGQGVITTVAGTQWVFRGEGGPATAAHLGQVQGVAVDTVGNLYALDADNHLLLKIAPSGTVSVLAGNGLAGFSGDGGPATSASIRLAFVPSSPAAVTVDGRGKV